MEQAYELMKSCKNLIMSVEDTMKKVLAGVLLGLVPSAYLACKLNTGMTLFNFVLISMT